MDTMKSAIGLCAKIYEMYGTFKSNKEKCHWLLELVETIMKSLKLQHDRNAVPEDSKEPLVNLHQQLESCAAVLDEYGCCSDFRKIVFGASHREQFEESGRRLTTCHTAFSHAVSIQLAADQRDQQQQMDAKLDMIQLALERAFQCDQQQYREEMRHAIHNASLLQALEKLGMSPEDIRHEAAISLAAPPARTRTITTFEDAQVCSWFMPSETIVIDKREVGRSRELQAVRLGKHGTFGDVYSAMHCNDTPVAVKKLKSPISAHDLASSDTARASFAAFVAEVSFAFSLKHPNIVRTLGGVVDALEEPPCWIVMERLEKSLAEVRSTSCAAADVHATRSTLRSQLTTRRNSHWTNQPNWILSWAYAALSFPCTHPHSSTIQSFLKPTPTVTSNPKTSCIKMALPS